MKVYDNYEISPCTRSEEPDSPGKFTFEVCETEEADVWTLYGHTHGEGVEAIGDFTTREAAVQVYSRITGSPFAGSYKADARLRVMHAGPRLLKALRDLLGDLPSVQEGVCLYCGRVYDDDDDGIQTGDCPSDDCPSFNARAAIAEATGGSRLEAPKSITIEVRGGVVQDVCHVPPGYAYEVKDYDSIEADEEASLGAIMSDPTNQDRAGWARDALAVFTRRTFSGDHPDTMDRDDLESAIGDLICDLMHFAVEHGFEPEGIIETARGNFAVEIMEAPR